MQSYFRDDYKLALLNLILNQYFGTLAYVEIYTCPKWHKHTNFLFIDLMMWTLYRRSPE